MFISAAIDRGFLRRGRRVGSCRADLMIVPLLFVALLAVYDRSPVRHISDSRYTMLLGEQLLLHRSFDLRRYFAPYVDSSDYPKVRSWTGLPRHVRRQGGELYHVYPYGSSLLSIPFLVGLRGFGLSTIDADGRYNFRAEMKIQAALASAITAATGVVLYLLARQLLPALWSVAIALVAALGSQLWSIASRVLWSHTWGLLLLALALLLLLRDERRLPLRDQRRLLLRDQRRLLLRDERRAVEGPDRDLAHEDRPRHPVLLASLLSWAFFVRPTAVAFIVPVTAWVVWRYGWRSRAYLVTGGAWLTAFLVHSQLVFGQPLPDYYQRGEGLGLGTLDLGLAANLTSPGRGLLIYSPWIWLSIYLLIRHWRRLQHRQLALTAIAAVTFHVMIVSCSINWWAGSCYGPRFTTETIPLWVLLTVLGWRAALDHLAEGAPRFPWRRRRHAMVLVVAVLLVLPSFTFHGAGALSKGWVPWNSVPEDIPWQPMRVFDWQEAQFLWALDPGRVERHRRDRHPKKPAVTVTSKGKERVGDVPRPWPVPRPWQPSWWAGRTADNVGEGRPLRGNPPNPPLSKGGKKTLRSASDRTFGPR